MKTTLRWIFFLPVAVIIYWVSNLLFVVMSDWVLDIVPDGTLHDSLAKVFASAAAAFCCVWLGALVAPSARFRVSISIAVFVLLFNLMVVPYAVYHTRSVSDIFAIFASCICAVLGCVYCRYQDSNA